MLGRRPGYQPVKETDELLAPDCDSAGSDGDGTSDEEARLRRVSVAAVGLLILGTCLIVFGLALGTWQLCHPHTPLLGSAPRGRTLRSGPAEKPIGADACDRNKGPFLFKRVPLSVPAARKAARHLLRLTKARLAECSPPVGLQIGGHSGFAKRHPMRASWKYARDCGSITFRLKILLPQRHKVWSGQVNFDLATHRWMPLEDAYHPPLCEIHNEGEDSPQRVPHPSGDPEVMEAAEFAVAQLSFLRQQQDCSGGLVLGLVRVDRASQQLSQDVSIMLELVLNVTSNATQASREETACVTVFVRYAEQPTPMNLATGFFGRGNFSVCSDPSTWGSAVDRKGTAQGLGEVDDEASDPTNRLVVQRAYQVAASQVAGPGGAARRLWGGPGPSGPKPPISLRYIATGNVPPEYDLRLDSTVLSCLNGIPVYDQGSCGCCYGAAMAQMFSIRLCMLDARNASAKVRMAANASRRLGSRHAEARRAQAAANAAPECKDDVTWRSPNSHDCTWYGQEPDRCGLADVGQLSYCRRACHTCPNQAVNLDRPGTLQKYAYATQDLATCACNDYDPTSTDPSTNCRAKAGCNGGSMWAVWDAWLRLAGRKLRRRDCMPLSIKCLNSVGVTNPLSGGQCQAYNNVPVWDRPCSCIPSNSVPHELPQCHLAEDSCSQLPAPEMVYQLMSSQNGLTLQATVLNMKRHILEAGPLYVAFQVSQGFMNFWQSGGGLSGEVYAGDNEPESGGHAVIIVGWGQTSMARPLGVGPDVQYWIFRNSWTEQWGEAGYGKIVAGRNVKGIEERLAVAMMGPHQDFTPPVCEWQRTEFPLMSYPAQLCRFEMKLAVQCSEEATMQVFWAKATGEEGPDDEPYEVFSGPTYRCPGLTDCVVGGFDLLFAGYGLQDASLYLKIRAWDQRGNVYSTSSTLPIEAIPGMSSVGGQRECGIPEYTCSGCIEPAWPEPKAVPAPAPPPPWRPPEGGPTLQPPTPPPWADDSGGGGSALREAVLPSAEERARQARAARTGSMNFCFPPDATVRLANGADRPLSALVAGDQLLLPSDGSRPAAVTPYLQDFHLDRADRSSAPTQYLRIEHALQKPGRPLLISANHLVFRTDGHGSRAAVPAGELRPGIDAVLAYVAGAPPASAGAPVLPTLAASVVHSVEEVLLPGFAAPLASSGELLVEGVLVSSYALLSEAQMDLWRRGPVVLRQRTQEICHFLALPFRLQHALWGLWWRLRPGRPTSDAGRAVALDGGQASALGAPTYLCLVSGMFDLLARAAPLPAVSV